MNLNETTPVNIDGEQAFKGQFNFEMLNEHIEIFVKENPTQIK